MLKRILDIGIVLLTVPLTIPVVGIVALLVAFKLGGPVLFIQTRAGLRGKPFPLIKFRSMLDARDKYGNVLPDDERLTSFGRWLRATSLDELPELWNVIKGEMSLVGPRPLHVRYLDRYSPVQMRRHDIRPGITGWAQINGRNQLCWEEKFKLDVWYVDNHSSLLDMKILLITISRVIKRNGISAKGEATMSEFLG